jgi:hypothetical protein
MNEGTGPFFTPLARTILTDSPIEAQMYHIPSDNKSTHYSSLQTPPVTALHIAS